MPSSALGAEVPGKARRVPGRQGRAVQLHQRERGARGREHAREGGPRRAHRHGRRPQAAAAQPGAALHDFDPAAGSLAQARLQRAEDHARRPAAVRGRRHRRGRGRSHHLHAHRLAQSRAGGRRADPRGHRRALRPGGPRRGSARLSHQIGERPGSPRGDPSDRCAHRAGGHREASSTRDQFRLYSLIWKRTMACQMAPAVFDTVAVELLAGADGAEAHGAARQRLDAGQARATYRCIRKARTTPCRTIRITCCRR